MAVVDVDVDAAACVVGGWGREGGGENDLEA